MKNSLIGICIDVGTIISKLCEAEYATVHGLIDDFHRMVDNCELFWTKYGGRDEVFNKQMFILNYLRGSLSNVIE